LLASWQVLLERQFRAEIIRACGQGGFERRARLFAVA
jgi:hypothetical protein